MGRKDTIKVFLRIRPDKDGKKYAPPYQVEHTFDDSKVHFHLDRKQRDDFQINNSIEDFRFKFDRIFEQQANQEDVFNMVAKDCVQSALDGYNSTIFAYGQTGSGKTFSITGGTASYTDRGIIPRAISMVYDEIAKQTEFSWTVRISYLQIYNDKGQDLLNHGNDARTLEELPPVSLMESDDEVVMKGLEAHPASSVHEALNLLFLGDTNRLYCETPMNHSSSRSHCVFTISLEARAHGSATVRRSKLNLVDLAGSERVYKTGVTGQLLAEAKYINISLHYLEHVIVSLSERKPHVPFRNSMMTMALRDSLGGNCRTAMLATVHPGPEFLMESVSTCKFASRVSCIKQNAKVNEELDPTVMVRKLKAEVALLKDKLAFYEKDDNRSDRELSADELQRCREMVVKYVEDPDPTSQLAGVGGDLARIMACFGIMKGMINGKGGVPKDLAPRPGSSTTAAGDSGGASSAEVAKLKSELEKLNISLQEKENELTLMFAIVEKTNAAKFNATTQTADGDWLRPGSNAGGLPSGRMQAEQGSGQRTMAVLAGGMKDRPPPIDQQSHPTLQPNNNNAGANREEMLVGAQISQQEDKLQGDYNLSALTDAELLQDRHVAFEAFRKSYRRHEQIEKNKNELKSMYERCQAAALELQRTQEMLKKIKFRVQQLRSERSLQGVEEPYDEEKNLLSEMMSLKQGFNEKAKVLEKEKERVDHMHLVVHRAQDQLTKDFQEWFSLRQKQVALAQRREAQQNRGGSQQPAPMALPAHQPQLAPAPPVTETRATSSAPGLSGTGAHPVINQAFASTSGREGSSSAGTHQQRTSPPPLTVPSAYDAPSAQSSGGSGGNGMISGSIMGRLRGANNSPPPTAPTNGEGSHLAGAAGGALQRSSSSSGANFVAEQHRMQMAQHAEHNARLAAMPTKPGANPYAPNYASTGNAAADADLAKMYAAREALRQQLS